MTFDMCVMAPHENILRVSNSPGAVHDAVQAVGDGEDSAL